jgi:RNA polymerase sigma factor (sigma-70 family)
VTARPSSGSLRAQDDEVTPPNRDELFGDLLRRDGAALRRVAASYERDRGLQEDLFQDICVAVWSALGSFRGESSPRTFAFRVAHNRATSHVVRRRRLRETDLERALEESPPVVASHEGALDAQQRAERLTAAVALLPLSLRQVLTLSLEGLSHREVGEVLDLTEGNVAVRMSRARTALRRLLGEPTDGE